MIPFAICLYSDRLVASWKPVRRQKTLFVAIHYGLLDLKGTLIYPY